MERSWFSSRSSNISEHRISKGLLKSSKMLETLALSEEEKISDEEEKSNDDINMQNSLDKDHEDEQMAEIE